MPGYPCNCGSCVHCLNGWMPDQLQVAVSGVADAGQCPEGEDCSGRNDTFVLDPDGATDYPGLNCRYRYVQSDPECKQYSGVDLHVTAEFIAGHILEVKIWLYPYASAIFRKTYGAEIECDIRPPHCVSYGNYVSGAVCYGLEHMPQRSKAYTWSVYLDGLHRIAGQYTDRICLPLAQVRAAPGRHEH